MKWRAMRLRERHNNPGDCEALVRAGADVVQAGQAFAQHERPGDREALAERLEDSTMWWREWARKSAHAQALIALVNRRM